MRKVIKWLTVVCILALIGWIGWKWYSVKTVSIDAFSLIPDDAIFCITTADPVQSWKDIAGSPAWNHLQRNTYFASLTASANSLDSLIRKNRLLFDLVGSRALIVSAHSTTTKDYDFLFLVDLKEAAGIKFINDYISDFSAAGFSIRKEKHGDEDLLVLHDPSDTTTLYVSQPGTYLVASYTKKLVAAALDTYKNKDAAVSDRFLTTINDLRGDGLMQLYVNYTMLPRFMASYSDGANEYVNRLSQTLHTTGLDVAVEHEMIKASGHTYVNDSVESYLKTLSISGKAGIEFAEVAPQRTAFCLGFGFSSFKEFFKNFESNLQTDITEYNSYRESLKRVEDYLNIDLQENFINWIGDEVALLELQSSGKGLDNETAILLKAENIEEARKDLSYIEKMIRKKTPVKFKAVEHRGHTISYLSMKGLFKILLGKFFARYDKPYYTIINNFVIFSNHPQTLKSIIDDYLDKNTLVKSDEFRSFRKQFEDEGSVFIYLNTPVLFSTMKKLTDYPTRLSMEKNKEYITCFRHVGFQLVPEPGRFKTLLAGQFIAPEAPATVKADAMPDVNRGFSLEENNDTDATAGREEEGTSDPMDLPYIYVKNVNASVYITYFSDSTIHYTVDLRNGFKDGSYTEYHSNGEVKMTGRFKNDKRDGTWRLYDESGKLIMRRNYEAGEVKKERIRD